MVSAVKSAALAAEPAFERVVGPVAVEPAAMLVAPAVIALVAVAPAVIAPIAVAPV